MGLYSAIGQTEIKDYTDKYNMDNALAIAKERRYAEAQAAANAAAEAKMYDINPTKLFGKSEVASQNKEVADELKSYYSGNKGYLTLKGGRVALTKAGREALEVAEFKHTVYDRVNGEQYTTTYKAIRDPKFAKFLKSQGISQADIDKAVSTGYSANLNNTMTRLRNRINSGELVTGTPNIDIYRITIGEEADETRIAKKLENILSNTEIEQIVGLHTTGKTITVPGGPTDDKGLTPIRRMDTVEFDTKKVSKKEFMKRRKNGARALYLSNSPLTNNQIIEFTDGTKYILPEGVLGDDAYSNLNNQSPTGGIEEGVSGINQRLLYSNDPADAATLLNLGNREVASALTYTKGASITPNDGTVKFKL